MTEDRRKGDNFKRKEETVELLEKLYLSRRLSADVHLIPSNATKKYDTLPAHKSILAVGCPYFQNLFFPEVKIEDSGYVTMAEPPIQSITKVDIPIEKIILELVLKCIYLDQYEITQDRWERLWESSKLLKLKKLAQNCLNFLKDQEVTKDNWLLQFRLAINMSNEKDMEMIERTCESLKLISTEILDTQGFVTLKFRELKMLVNAGIFINSVDLQKAKLKWFAHENHTRITHMDDLIKLDLPQVASNVNPSIQPLKETNPGAPIEKTNKESDQVDLEALEIRFRQSLFPLLTLGGKETIRRSANFAWNHFKSGIGVNFSRLFPNPCVPGKYDGVLMPYEPEGYPTFSNTTLKKNEKNSVIERDPLVLNEPLNLCIPNSKFRIGSDLILRTSSPNLAVKDVPLPKTAKGNLAARSKPKKRLQRKTKKPVNKI